MLTATLLFFQKQLLPFNPAADNYIGGDDSLTGGRGRDTFVYSNKANSGHDTILDFNLLLDSIGLVGGLTASDIEQVDTLDGNPVSDLTFGFATPGPLAQYETSYVTLSGIAPELFSQITFVEMEEIPSFYDDFF